ncbi:copper-translocating P-type ATPase [Romboutsia maritimum]|uniref:Cd(2+)-exporting ATPase n=1 Tax=Romboutsia maritimum TaxID=2020948 RepID=A0A371IV16_9FIRM|nr:cation-translocating P-type ATPase [Romboutsia maritimum]RDY24311.1 copper-translocating P-type ATPase [Romboutsia maritimum]
MNKFKDWILPIISGICLILSLLGWLDNILPFDIAWGAVILSGFPIIKDSTISLITKFDIKADVLVSLALIASIIIGEIFAAGEIAFIMTIGALLEDKTVEKAHQGIKSLINLTPRTARLIKSDSEEIISADDVKIGDILRVIPGETIPVDGVIISGQTSIDQSVMTGESLPVDKCIYDNVFSGTINQFGSFDMKATKIDKDSSLQRMIKLVESANANKAPIVSLTDKWATWIVIIALSFSILTWFITKEIIRSVTILVVFCPCALVLATPTAIMAAIGNSSKFGILIRSGDALERLDKINRIAFDKTGTLTYGKPKVVAIESFQNTITKTDLLYFAASLEQRSEHPLGRAILNHYNENSNSQLAIPESFNMIPGRGVKATIKDKNILAGNLKMILENNISLDDDIRDCSLSYNDKGCTIIFISINNKLCGFVALADTPRLDSINTINKIHSLGVKSLLLTGDNAYSANNIGKKVGIDNISFDLLPEDKMKVIKNYQQDKNEQICMIGDGVNDAPALKTASVGIALGSIGSDIAIDSSDIAIIGDDISKIPYLIELSRKTMSTIRINVVLSLGLNFIAIILAILGILHPVVGALVHNTGSVAVIINSTLLLKFKENKTPNTTEELSI